MRRTQQQSRISVFGWGTRAELGTTTCTRNTVTPLLTEVWNRCTLRWLLDTVSDSLASRSSRQPLSQPSCARERSLNSSTTARSSSHWCSARWDHQAGSWRRLTRPPSPTCSCRTSQIDSFLGWNQCWSYAPFCFGFSRIFLFINMLGVLMNLNSTLSGFYGSCLLLMKNPFPYSIITMLCSLSCKQQLRLIKRKMWSLGLWYKLCIRVRIKYVYDTVLSAIHGQGHFSHMKHPTEIRISFHFG